MSSSRMSVLRMDTDDKNIRDERLRPIYDAPCTQNLMRIYPEQGAMLDECIYKLQKFVVRRWLLDDGKRVDGRGMDEIRPLAAEVGLIPRVHGSGMFTRGQTQVLTIATLGYHPSMRRSLTASTSETSKRYMHQYNYPVLLGRRGQAHPAAPAVARSVTVRWRSVRLMPVLPPVEEFPYAIRAGIRGSILQRFHLSGAPSAAPLWR